MTGSSYSIAPYEVTQYSKGAQTEPLGEGQANEEQEPTDDDEEGQLREDKDSDDSGINVISCP